MSHLHNPTDGRVVDADTCEHKTDFTSIYTSPDPRDYFAALAPLQYQMPQRALLVLQSVLDASRHQHRRHTMLDLCCSYGIASAMLYAPFGPDQVVARYLDPAAADLTPDQLADADARVYAARRTDVRVVGLDISAPALVYGRRAGLLAEAWCEDLEREEPSPGLVAGLGDVGVIFSTGGVGYVGACTFERLLRHAPDLGQLWLAIFVLRVFDYAPIAQLLGDYGLVTDRLPGTFPQRQFADAEEQAAALRDVRRRGLDPTGRESTGWFHADCFVSRPASQAATPLRLRR